MYKDDVFPNNAVHILNHQEIKIALDICRLNNRFPKK